MGSDVHVCLQTQGGKATGAEPERQQAEVVQGPGSSRGQEGGEGPAAASPSETSPLLDSLTACSTAVHSARVTPASLGDSAHAAPHNGPSSSSRPERGKSHDGHGSGADSNGGGAKEGQSFAFTKGCYFLGKAVWGKVGHVLRILLPVHMGRLPRAGPRPAAR